MRNFVAKYMRKFNKYMVFKNKKKYTRKIKHRNYEERKNIK